MTKNQLIIEGLKYCKNRYDSSCVNCTYPSLDCAIDDAILKLEEYDSGTDTTISFALDCLLHPHSADESDMMKAMDTAILILKQFKRYDSKPPIWKERIVPVFEEYEDGTGAIKNQNWSDWFCPTCGGLVGERYRIPGREPHDQHRCNYCPKCGQAIDWEDIERKDGK